MLSHCTFIFYGLRKICARPAEFTTLGRTNYFFIVVVIRYDTAATAHWTLMFIVRAFINHHHHRCSLDMFSCVRLMEMLPHPRDYIRWCFADPAVADAFAKESATSLMDSALH